VISVDESKPSRDVATNQISISASLTSPSPEIRQKPSPLAAGRGLDTSGDQIPGRRICWLCVTNTHGKSSNEKNVMSFPQQAADLIDY
jgi:hypothetical protein